MHKGNITDIKGVLAGHATNSKGKTGCTVVIFPEGAVAGVDVRGAAPGTRETDLLRPGNLVKHAHAILLTGGSAFGLDAASGVMRWLEEQGIGFETGVARVPIVPAAVLYDLAVGDAKARPDGAMGYEVCCAASSAPLEQGQVGAGAGATVGKALGLELSSPGGVGSASIKLASGVTVAAVIAVNALGDVLDYRTNEILAGIRLPGGGFHSTHDLLVSGSMPGQQPGANTTIGVIATDAALTKEQANRLASVAHDGLAWSIRPVHTTMDGDTLFAASYGDKEAEFLSLCAAAVEVVARAVGNAVASSQMPVVCS